MADTKKPDDDQMKKDSPDSHASGEHDSGKSEQLDAPQKVVTETDEDKDQQSEDSSQDQLAELEAALASRQSERHEKEHAQRNQDAHADSALVAKVKAEDTMNAPQSHDQKKSEKAPSTGLLWFFTLLHFLAIIAIIGAGYWYWQQLQTEDNSLQELEANFTTQLSRQTSANDQMQQQQQQLREQNASLAQQIANLSQAVEQAKAAANAVEKNLSEIKGRRPSDWLLAEADYLVRMAGRKLWLEKDLTTAVLMLQSADSRLQDLADPSLLPVRQLIANDVQTLQQVNPVSLSSISLALASLLPQIDSLPLAIHELPEIKTLESNKQSGWEQTWRFFVDELFSYQPRNSQIKPVLTEQQKWLAREQLKMTLLQAQAAVTQENPALFQQNMQRALGSLISHFDLTNDSVGRFVESLENLANTNIERKFPAQLQSARPLNDLLKQRLNAAFTNQVSEL